MSFRRIANAADVPDGWALAARDGARTVAVVNSGGVVRALDGTCPHAGGPLGDSRVRDGCLRCPWHDSAFDVQTGEAVCGPARRGVAVYETRIAGDGAVEIRTG